jgi:hypothetical protein
LKAPLLHLSLYFKRHSAAAARRGPEKRRLGIIMD